MSAEVMNLILKSLLLTLRLCSQMMVRSLSLKLKLKWGDTYPVHCGQVCSVVLPLSSDSQKSQHVDKHSRVLVETSWSSWGWMNHWLTSWLQTMSMCVCVCVCACWQQKTVLLLLTKTHSIGGARSSHAACIHQLRSANSATRCTHGLALCSIWSKINRIWWLNRSYKTIFRPWSIKYPYFHDLTIIFLMSYQSDVAKQTVAYPWRLQTTIPGWYNYTLTIKF